MAQFPIAPPRSPYRRAQQYVGQDNGHITLLQHSSVDSCDVLSNALCVLASGIEVTPLNGPSALRSLMMSVNFRELEEGLTRLESIDAARVVHQGDKITEIHVIAASDKPSKQVARDVQSLAMARFGLPIDHRIISVVQISPQHLDLTSSARAALRGVSESPNGTRTTIEVTLHHEDEEHTGTATGPAVSSARLRLIGEATIDAIERTFETMPPIALDSIAVTNVGSRNVVVAVLVTAGMRGSEDLNVGSSISAGATDEAAVKAVLNALNRRLGALTE